MEAGGGEKPPALPTALPVEERARTAAAATRAAATAMESMITEEVREQ